MSGSTTGALVGPRTTSHIIYKNRNGKRLPGASTISGVYSGGFGSDDNLINWGIKQAFTCASCNGVVELENGATESVGPTLQGICTNAACDDFADVGKLGVRLPGGHDHVKVRNESSDFGTCVHAFIQADFQGRPLPYSDHIPKYTAVAEKALGKLKEWLPEKQLVMNSSEDVYTSETHQYGGSLDATFVLAGAASVLGDFKTSTFVSRNHVLQVAGGYSILWEERHQRELENVLLARFDRVSHQWEDHWYGREAIVTAQKGFLQCRALYETMKSLRP
jgi:hypothetical protein